MCISTPYLFTQNQISQFLKPKLLQDKKSIPLKIEHLKQLYSITFRYRARWRQSRKKLLFKVSTLALTLKR